MRFRDLGFRQRFLLIGAVLVFGFGVLALFTDRIVRRVMVTGEIYEEVTKTGRSIGDWKDLVADIYPPPLFIVEAHLACVEMAAEPNADQRANLEMRVHDAQAEFERRREHWLAHPPAGSPVAQALLGDAATAAQRYFEVVHDAFLPALAAGERAPRPAASLLREELAPLFERHREAVRRAVDLTDTEIAAARSVIAQSEAEASDAVHAGRRTAFLVSAATLLVTGLVAFLVLRSVLRSIRLLNDRMREMVEREAGLAERLQIDSRDEVGQLARWIDAFIAKIADLVRAVRRSSVQLTSTSTQMAATSHEQQSTVQGFGAATTQIAAAVQEISATGAELLRTMDEANRIARASADLASTGRTSLRTMESTMKDLEESSASISGRLGAINERAGDITSVVTTITKVADQTNLLSVNAAIEAEKAGEYGRGFLVVAQEVRRLADQTAAATLEIEQTVREMQGAVSGGVMEMDKFAQRVRRSVADAGEVSGKLGQILEQVEDTKARFESVKDGMRSQAEGASQINEAMRGLAENVQTTVASLQEFTGAAEDLRGAATLLREQLSRFRLEE